MRRGLFLAAAFLTASLQAEVPPRISFQKVLPAPHNATGAEDLAIVYAIGDNEQIKTFLDAFVDHANRTGVVRVWDALSSARKPRADLYLRVTAFSCRTEDRSGEGSVYDQDGRRVRTTQRWATATCIARVEVLRGERGAASSSFTVSGEGTSSRTDRVTEDERSAAAGEAAHYTARAAVEMIAPRKIRETIELDPAAPAFREGMSMIESGRLDEARRIWERAKKNQAASAPLHHNLAAVCEAVGDVEAAERYFRDAQRFEPGAMRHKIELEMFRRRNDPGGRK